MSEDREKLIEQANLARIIKASAADMILNQQDEIIRRLVGKYETGKLDAGALFGMAGELSAIRRFTYNLDRSINLGIKAVSKEVSDGEKASKAKRSGRFRRT